MLGFEYELVKTRVLDFEILVGRELGLCKLIKFVHDETNNVATHSLSGCQAGARGASFTLL